jgi:hypothetical protein
MRLTAHKLYAVVSRRSQQLMYLVSLFEHVPSPNSAAVAQWQTRCYLGMML